MEEIYQKQIQEEANAIFEMMSPRTSDEDMARIRKAFDLACYAHRDQRRKSGHPYIIHPVAVARIVAEELELGADPVIAAFLHDVVEDTDYTLEQIHEMFGGDVAFLVGTVTKQKKKTYNKSKQVDNFRQILESVQSDFRPVLVKLADRLHNMRTLASMRPDKQLKIAGETDYFYAPLANRLGLYQVKSELENLSFQYRCPSDYDFVERMLEELKIAEKENVEAFLAKARDVLKEGGVEANVEVRYRKPCSIWRRMTSMGCDFHHIGNKHYVRISYKADTVPDEKRLSLKIYSLLSNHFQERPGSVVNYINAPKENGYQSLHVKFLNDQRGWEEVHISSERMVREGRLGCGAERRDDTVKKWITKFRSMLRDVSESGHAIDYMDGVTASFYNDDIMTFTPEGKGVILPKNATALDFAFEIHSGIGLHAYYARINGRLCSVKTVLHRGDCVEIGTNPDSAPSLDWMEHVHTYKAKRHLRAYFADRPKQIYTRCSCCHPLPGDQVIGFKDANDNIVIHKRTCALATRLASEQGDSILAISFDERPDEVFPVRIQLNAIDRPHLLRDVVECITEQLNLSILHLNTTTIDNIVETSIDFFVHSINELYSAINTLIKIDSVEQVSPRDVE